MHSCLHTGQRITFTGAKHNHYSGSRRQTRTVSIDVLFFKSIDRYWTNTSEIGSWLLLVNKETHVVSHRPPGSLAPRPWPNSSTAWANISCKTSAGTEEVWAPDCRSSGSKRDTSLDCLAQLQRTFCLALACSQLRSLKARRRLQQKLPLPPPVPRRHPYAALSDGVVRRAPAQVRAARRKSHFLACLLRREQPVSSCSCSLY